VFHEFTKEIADLVLELTHEGDNEDNYYFPLLNQGKQLWFSLLTD
jgi:hypothetical protein